MSLISFKNVNPQNVFTNHIYLINMYKEYLVLNNLEWLICYKIQPNQTKPNYFNDLNYCYLSAVDPQLPFSSTLMIKQVWVLVFYKSN